LFKPELAQGECGRRDPKQHFLPQPVVRIVPPPPFQCAVRARGSASAFDGQIGVRKIYGHQKPGRPTLNRQVIAALNSRGGLRGGTVFVAGSHQGNLRTAPLTGYPYCGHLPRCLREKSFCGLSREDGHQMGNS